MNDPRRKYVQICLLRLKRAAVHVVHSSSLLQFALCFLFLCVYVLFDKLFTMYSERRSTKQIYIYLKIL